MTHKELTNPIDVFDKRLGDLFPYTRILTPVTNTTKIKAVLLHILHKRMNPTPEGQLPDDSFWWFRGSDSYWITDVKQILGRRFLFKSNLNFEWQISQMVAYRNKAKPDTSFLYIECLPDEADHTSEDYIQSRLSGGFGSQYAMEHFEAEERTRMVTKFNCFIAPRGSRLHQLDSMSQMAMDEMCNGLLWQDKSLNEDSVALLDSLTIG